MLLVWFFIIDVFNSIKVYLGSFIAILEFLNHFWTCYISEIQQIRWQIKPRNPMNKE